MRAAMVCRAAISLRFHSTILVATPSVINVVASSAITGGAITTVRNTASDSRSIIAGGASR